MYVDAVNTIVDSNTNELHENSNSNYNKFQINSLNYNIVWIKTSNYSYFELDNVQLNLLQIGGTLN